MVEIMFIRFIGIFLVEVLSEELPKAAVVRECLEEVGLDQNDDIIHEDSNLDNGIVYTRLVYDAHLPKNKEIIVTLNPEEHTDYRWISDLNDLDGEKLFLIWQKYWKVNSFVI